MVNRLAPRMQVSALYLPLQAGEHISLGNAYHCDGGGTYIPSGEHISRGNTYHCNTGPWPIEGTRSPALSAASRPSCRRTGTPPSCLPPTSSTASRTSTARWRKRAAGWLRVARCARKAKPRPSAVSARSLYAPIVRDRTRK